MDRGAARGLWTARIGAVALGPIACSEDVITAPPDGGGSAAKCPEVPGTWEMVAVRPAVGATFCVDAREVTKEQYAAFLAAGTGSSGLHSACDGDADRTPNFAWP